MQIQLLSSVLLMAMCAKAMPVTITGGTDDTPTVIESDGTDVVKGDASDTDDPGKTIFVPDSDSAVTVIPTQEDPSVLSPGGIPVTITPGSDGVVIVPGNNGGTGGAVIS